ncbi:MAG: hypothetical protein JW904_13060 [Spirochaetales bacterium]|nr:hypothetical protein [Spirochaetales bacterium]
MGKKNGSPLHPGEAQPHIGLLKERSLHAALKELYLPPGAQQEVKLGRIVVDILAAPDCIFEIQTRGLGKLRRKLENLLEKYRVTIVYPVAAEKTILLYDKHGEKLVSKRKSPKKNSLSDIAFECAGIREYIGHRNLYIEVVFTREEEIRHDDGKGSWRRKGKTITDRKLVDIKEKHVFHDKKDFLKLLPSPCPRNFTNRKLASRLKIHVSRAQQITYLLRSLGLLAVKGKQGNSFIFQKNRLK